MVIPRAIIRDLHTGVEATRLMSLVMLVFSVSPILAPLDRQRADRAVRLARGVRRGDGRRGARAAAARRAVLPETRPAQERIEVSIGSVLDGFGQLLRDRHFLGLTFIGGLGMSSFFAFLASSSFVYIDHFGLTPTQYSLAFSVNAIGFIGASQFAAALGAALRHGRASCSARSRLRAMFAADAAASDRCSASTACRC